MSGRKRKSGTRIPSIEDRGQRKITAYLVPIQRDDQAAGGTHPTSQEADAMAVRKKANPTDKAPIHQFGNCTSTPVLVDIATDSDEEPSVASHERESPHVPDLLAKINENTFSSNSSGSKPKISAAARVSISSSSSENEGSDLFSVSSTQTSCQTSWDFSESDLLLEQNDSNLHRASEEKYSLGESIWERRKKWRFYTREKEKEEFKEIACCLPSIKSLDSSTFAKPVTSEIERKTIFEAAVNTFSRKHRISLAPGLKKFECCGKTYTKLYSYKKHVAANHLPSGSISLSLLKDVSALLDSGLSMKSNILDAIKGEEAAEFVHHLRIHADALMNIKCYQKCNYNLVLLKNLPSQIPADKVLDYASSSGSTIEVYSGKNSRGRRENVANCSKYHFTTRYNNLGKSFVTQCLLQGYRCFSIVEENQRFFESRESMEITEMFSQLFFKLCARYTQHHGGNFTFTCRQQFEHDVAKEHLTEEDFLKVVEDVIICKGQAVVYGDAKVTVPFNGRYGQIKAIKLVEHFIEKGSKFKIRGDVEERPVMRHVNERITHISKVQALELQYDVAKPNEMTRLWDVLDTKYWDSARKNHPDNQHSIALVILVPDCYDTGERNVYDFMQDEFRNGRKVKYDFIREIDKHLYYKIFNLEQKYLVIKKWNFDSADDKAKFFNFVLIYSHFQTALCDQYFEFAHFKINQIVYPETKRLLSEEELRYAYALGLSGRPVICLEKNCNINHYIFNDQKFVVPIKIDDRIMIDIPMGKYRY